MIAGRTAKRILTTALLFCVVFSASISFVQAEDVRPYSGKFEYIAYSQIRGIGDAPANSLEHFKHCSSSEYTYSMLKGDLRLTSDNRIIMCHDPGFTLNSKGNIIEYDPDNRVAIRDMTYDQCIALKYERTFHRKQASVCGFDQYLSICADNNKKAFITVRKEYIDELTEPMLTAIEQHGMKHDCVINSSSNSALQVVREKDPYIRLSLIAGRGTLNADLIDKAAGMGNCLINIDIIRGPSASELDWVTQFQEEIAYAQENGIDIFISIIEDVTCIDKLKRYGISGAQIKVDSKAPVEIPCGTIRITSVSKRTAALVKARNKEKVVIPATVTVNGRKYKITTIYADAFTGKKIRKVALGKNISTIRKNAFRRSKATSLEIRTKELKRANVKGAFRGSQLKRARVRIGKKATNKIYAAKYKAILKSKRTGRNLKITY